MLFGRMVGYFGSLFIPYYLEEKPLNKELLNDGDDNNGDERELSIPWKFYFIVIILLFVIAVFYKIFNLI